MMLDVTAAEERRRDLAAWYAAQRGVLDAFTTRVAQALQEVLDHAGVPYERVAWRTKELESFLDKAAKPARDDPSAFKYDDPRKQITDLSGLRVTVLLQDTVRVAEDVIRRTFKARAPEVAPESADPTVPGYLSVHYLVELPQQWWGLGDYAGLKAEIQLRTVLQHAWAQIQHDILYKESGLPSSPGVERRLRGLAGMLELADREFQVIRSELEEEQEAADAAAEVAPGGDPPLDAAVLRAYLQREFQEQEEVDLSWIDAMLVILNELQIHTLSHLEETVGLSRVEPASLRERLSVEGHDPNPVEMLDGYLRAALGDVYLERRSEYWSHLDAGARQRAKDAVHAFRTAVRTAD